MDQQHFSNSELLMPSMYRTRGQLIVWTLGPAAASWVYICEMGEEALLLGPSPNDSRHTGGRGFRKHGGNPEPDLLDDFVTHPRSG